jgi:hypothetical protein
MPLCCRTPSAGRLRLLAPLLIVLAACTRSPASKLSSTDSAPATRDSTDSLRTPITDHYVKLLRAQLTAKDPYQAAVAIHCEQGRIITLMTNEADDPLEGQNEAIRLLHRAGDRAYTSDDRPARDRVDRALAGKVFDARAGCDSLARAGVLGDTVMPQLRPRRF